MRKSGGKLCIGLDLRDGKMSRHDRTYTGTNRRAEGNQLGSVEFRTAPGNTGNPEMRVYADVSVPGKMFGGRERAVVFHSTNEFSHIFGDAIRVFAERANVDDRVI